MSLPYSTADLTHWRVFWRHAWLFGVVLVFSFVVALLSLTLPLFILLVYDRVLNSRSIETLTTLLIMAAILLGAMGLLDFSRKRLLARFAAILQHELEPHLISLRQGWGAKERQDGINLESLDNLRRFVHSGALINVIDALWLPIYLGAVFLISPEIGWLAVGGLIVLGIALFVGHILASHRMREGDAASGSASRMVRNLKRFHATSHGLAFSAPTVAEVSRRRAASRLTAIRASDVIVGTQTLLATLRWIMAALVLSAGAALVLAGSLTTGGMIASFVLLNRTFFPFIACARSLGDLKRAIASWNEIGKIMQDRPVAKSATCWSSRGGPILRLRSVSLKLGTADLDSCVKIDLTLDRGEIANIVGPTGSGKSLLCRAIAGSLRPESGLMLLAERPMETMGFDEIAQIVGFVSETPVFLSDTIAANISSYETTHETAQTRRAARAARIDRRISTLPNGYATQLDEFGRPLDRGTRDLLLLARALFWQPGLIIIDEPSDTLRRAFERDLTRELADLRNAGVSLLIASRTPVNLPQPVRRYRLSAEGLTLEEALSVGRPVAIGGVRT
jgi:ABC-type protease/lipase transport system fused ATPase/permease subunit